MSYLQGLFTEVYFKDIVERYEIELLTCRRTDGRLMPVNGSLTNAIPHTVRQVKVSGTTISNYLNYLMSLLVL